LKSTKDTDRERALCASSAGLNVHLMKPYESKRQTSNYIIKQ